MKQLQFILLILVVGCTTAPQKNKAPEPVKIIFDTDMGPDYDDVGAIAILHALADNDECEILATISCNSHPSVAPTIELFNRYFNKPNIPIGIPEKNGVNSIHKNNWNDSTIVKFAPELKDSRKYPSATKLYRKILSSQPDTSVTIVTVGFTTNLENLLKSGADEFSSLSGIEIVNKKVKKLVAMAGYLPEGREYNVYKHSEASFYTFKHWPTPILLSGAEIGNSIKTGNKLAATGAATNPVAWTYAYNFATYGNKPAETRRSWDQTAVLCAIRDPEKYFYVCGPGEFLVAEDGYNQWNPNPNANHYFLVHKYPYKLVTNVVEELMMHEPM